MSKIVTRRNITAKILNGDMDAKDCDFRDNLGYNTTRFFIQLEEKELEEYLEANGWFVTSENLYLRGTLDTPDILVKGRGLTEYTQIYVYTAGEAYNPTNFPGLTPLPELETTDELVQHTIDLSFENGGLFGNPTQWRSEYWGSLKLGTSETVTKVDGFVKVNDSKYHRGQILEYVHAISPDIRIIMSHDGIHLNLWSFKRNGARIDDIEGVIKDIADKLVGTGVVLGAIRNYGELAEKLTTEIQEKLVEGKTIINMKDLEPTPTVYDEDKETKTPWIAKCTCGESLFFGTLFAIFALTIEHMVRH